MIFCIRGGFGPLDHAAIDRASLLIGKGTHFQWNDFDDSLIQTGRGIVVSDPWELERICSVSGRSPPSCCGYDSSWGASASSASSARRFMGMVLVGRLILGPLSAMRTVKAGAGVCAGVVTLSSSTASAPTLLVSLAKAPSIIHTECRNGRGC